MSSATLSSLLDIFASPVQVFSKIKEKTVSAWLPFFVLVLISGVIFSYYFLTVDIYAFMETNFLVSGQEVSAQEFEQMMETEQVIRIVSVISSIVMIALVYLLTSGYFYLAATIIVEEKFTFSQCFALVTWGSFPSLISFLSMAVTLMTSQGFVYLGVLDKTNAASLFGIPFDSEFFNAATSLSAGSLWSYILYGLGFWVITRCHATTATFVALIPPAFAIGWTLLF